MVVIGVKVLVHGFIRAGRGESFLLTLSLGKQRLIQDVINDITLGVPNNVVGVRRRGLSNRLLALPLVRAAILAA